MNPFDYIAAHDSGGALAALEHSGGGRFIAGGTNLLDLMKARVARVPVLVDINRTGHDAITWTDEGGLSLGALARNADTADHPLVREHAPLLRAALLAGASPQIRNRATNAGNLLQRTRCLYFYDVQVPCNKRDPGSGCPAATGLARQHAILGASAHCVATHPSDFCVALAALDASVQVQSRRGGRRIPFADFHRLPGDRPEVDTTLADDELITSLHVPPSARFVGRCTYLKVRDRASYAFALVSVAAALDVAGDGRIREARLALGGVAHRPWRDPQAEALLAGRRPDTASFEAAADRLLAEARPVGAPPGNAFKVLLARRAIVRALQMALDGVSTNTGEDAARRRGAAA